MLDQHLSSMRSAVGQIGYGWFWVDFGACTKNVTYPPKKNFLGFKHVNGNESNKAGH